MTDIPRCRVTPLPEHQFAFTVQGQELTRWHFGRQYPRPFFFPLSGPASKSSLTRMGHPGAPNHDHHRSVWFAHHKLLGINFWGDEGQAVIRQEHWLVLEDGDDRAAMAVQLGWYDGHDPQPLVRQELIAVLSPLAEGEYTLDLQSTFTPIAQQIEFQQTNFGFLAVRVAKSISAHFGGGRLTSSEGTQGEQSLFEKQARWMDYSGPMPGHENDAQNSEEGITYFDHPANPGYPTVWHVRDDGWMGAAVCQAVPVLTTRERPLRLRYLLHAHRGPIDPGRANQLQQEWQQRPYLQVVRATRPHQQFELQELPEA